MSCWKKFKSLFIRQKKLNYLDKLNINSSAYTKKHDNKIVPV